MLTGVVQLASIRACAVGPRLSYTLAHPLFTLRRSTRDEAGKRERGHVNLESKQEARHAPWILSVFKKKKKKKSMLSLRCRSSDFSLFLSPPHHPVTLAATVLRMRIFYVPLPITCPFSQVPSGCHDDFTGPVTTVIFILSCEKAIVDWKKGKKKKKTLRGTTGGFLL